MSSERTEEVPAPPASADRQTSDRQDGETIADNAQSGDPTRQATVIVRGETVPSQSPKSAPKDVPPKNKDKPPRKEVSDAKVKLQNRLPALDDDADIGVQKEQVVVRDGKADLAFSGTLLASAASPSAAKGQWQEYRIYETTGAKHVFSKATRSVFAEDQDTHEAEVFDPAPSSAPAQLLRSARDLTRSRPMTWMDAAVAFFGYDPLAKILYRKLSGQFEEHIS
jgi:hypothetical protein